MTLRIIRGPNDSVTKNALRLYGIRASPFPVCAARSVYSNFHLVCGRGGNFTPPLRTPVCSWQRPIISSHARARFYYHGAIPPRFGAHLRALSMATAIVCVDMWVLMDRARENFLSTMCSAHCAHCACVNNCHVAIVGQIPQAPIVLFR